MALYHVSPEGPRRCQAENGGCPYARAGEPHFGSQEDAQQFFEQKMESAFGMFGVNRRPGALENLRQSGYRALDQFQLQFKTVQAAASEIKDVEDLKAIFSKGTGKRRAEKPRRSSRLMEKLGSRLSNVTEAWKEGWNEAKAQGELHRLAVQHAREERIHHLEQEFAAARIARQMKKTNSAQERANLKAQERELKDRKKEDAIEARRYGKEVSVASAAHLREGDYIAPGMRVSGVFGPEDGHYSITLVNEDTNTLQGVRWAANPHERHLIRRPTKRELRSGQSEMKTPVEKSSLFSRRKKVQEETHETVSLMELLDKKKAQPKAPAPRRNVFKRAPVKSAEELDQTMELIAFHSRR